MGVANEALRKPAYQDVQPGVPPRDPLAPRLPHVPHHARKAIAILAALAVAGASATGTWLRKDGNTPEPRPGAVNPEQMSYPYYKQLLNVTISPDGKPVEELTTTPQILRAGDSFYVPIFVPSYGNPNDPENRFGHITIVMLNEVMQGGAMLRESDANGNAIVGPNGEPNFINPDQVENLSIPEQVQTPVTV